MVNEHKFALVHDWLTVPGGSENVFKEITSLFPGVAFTSQVDKERLPFLKEMEVRTSRIQGLPWALSKHYIYAPLMPKAYSSFDLSEFDVVLVDSHSFAHHVRPRPDALFFCYYYTPARSLWVPEIDQRATTGRLAWLKRSIAKRLKPLDYEAAQKPHVRYAISHTSGERVERFYNVKLDGVIYPPVETEVWSDVLREGDDEGMLMWGRLIPYKRVDLAIEAAKITGDKLNIVGSGPDEGRLKHIAGDAKNIVFHGRLSDADLKKLMSRCRGVLFPNYEDFGIIPVEAMAAGLPVVAYAEGGVKETVTPECGVHFNEQTPESLARAMQELARKTFDVAHLKQHASQFNTERFRREYKAAVERAMDVHFG